MKSAIEFQIVYSLSCVLEMWMSNSEIKEYACEQVRRGETYA